MNLFQSTIISGPTNSLEQACFATLKKVLCCKKNCVSCVNCDMIQSKKHHHMLWINPEKKYTLETLEPIFLKIAFALSEHESFFFILNQADLLTAACANTLLKIVEEPPRGYYFIFLTQQAQSIIATIRSRSHIVYTHATTSSSLSPFLQHFTHAPSSPASFLKDLQTYNLDDHEIPEALDQLFVYWSDYSKKIITEKNDSTRAFRMISLLQKYIEFPPMPGSSKIFWRNLYLLKDTIYKESHGTP